MATKYLPKDRGNGHHPITKDSNGGQKTTYCIEIKYGPDPHGPARCFHCHKKFVAGDSWRLYWDPDHVYALGLHNSCIVEMEMA